MSYKLVDTTYVSISYHCIELLIHNNAAFEETEDQRRVERSDAGEAARKRDSAQKCQ
jgi:hypothetical protein